MTGTLKLNTNFDMRKAVQLLAGISRRADNLRPWFDKVARAMVASEITNFATQGSLDGGWPPLSPKYGLWKATNEAGRPMMVSTGKLLASVSRKDRLVQSMTGKSMKLGSDVNYAHFHQSGTKNMPKRKVVVLPESVMGALKQDLSMYVAHGRLIS
ncbi:Phage virion morphogensis protein [uncultured Caudovirales phage]|uniref:Phage virion morphogensis protein n=1 Tax=uncultured Caudovirales phage TaxID=2100421 RepID=A0A6J5RGB6_9CAUD|nr:Phage virion morphogensis protein [uncultured Caudovirales phage]